MKLETGRVEHKYNPSFGLDLPLNLDLIGIYAFTTGLQGSAMGSVLRELQRRS